MNKFLPALLLAAGGLFGQDLRLDEYRGSVVVVNFWATWCEPCRDEMPLFVAAHRRYAARGVVIVGASADDEKSQPQIPAFLRKHKIEFPIRRGANTEHMKAMGLGEGLPATAFLDRNGQIAYRILGPLTREELEQRIEYLLGSPGVASPEPLVNRLEAEHKEGENHTHGGGGMEGASLVPS